MPPAAPTPPTPLAHRAARVRFRRALSLLAMTLLLPGSAQLVAGNRAVGRWAIRCSAALLGLLVVFGLVSVWWHELPIWLATTPAALQGLRIGLVLLGVAWAALFANAWRLGMPATLDAGHRRATLLGSTLAALTVVSMLVYGSHVVSTQRSMVLSLFSGKTKSAAVDGRYNVLLIGADSGVTRWGLRTDSMTLASIDASTGKTVLIGLPRNMMNFPFPAGSILAKQWPHGYNCATCELNSLSTYAGNHPALFSSFDNPGVEATIEGVEGITGLKVNYWAMVNMLGFKELSDAVGGVTINVRQPIAIGKTGDVTGWIQPGVRKLSGEQLLWYTRSRATSDDYSRMARQKCVMNAMLTQLSPTSVLTHYEALANASKGVLKTSIPPGEVDTFISLAMKARSQKLATLSLVPPLVNTSHPDVKAIQADIQQTLHPAPSAGASAGATSKSKKKSALPQTTTTMTEGSLGSLKTGYAANSTDDLAAVC